MLLSKKQLNELNDILIKDYGKELSQKQRQALHKFGIQNVPEELTSKEASEVLDMLISLSKERNSEAINKMVEELNAGKEWAIWNTG